MARDHKNPATTSSCGGEKALVGWHPYRNMDAIKKEQGDGRSASSDLTSKSRTFTRYFRCLGCLLSVGQNLRAHPVIFEDVADGNRRLHKTVVYRIKAVVTP